MSILESALLGSTQFLDKTEEIKLIFLPPGNKWKKANSEMVIAQLG